MLANTGDSHRPETPQGLAAKVIDDETIQLNWMVSNDNVATVGYKVYNRGEEVADVARPVYTHQNLAPVTTYRYSLKAYDAAGNLSFENPQLVVYSGDTTAPTVPQSVTAQVINDGKISLSWQASDDNAAIAGYRVYERSTLLGETTETTYMHDDRAPVSQYAYAVVAFDATGNLSPASSPVVVHTGDTTSPDAPQGFTGQVINDRRISLSWLPATDNVSVAGYLVFNRGKQFADVTDTSLTICG